MVRFSYPTGPFAARLGAGEPSPKQAGAWPSPARPRSPILKTILTKPQ